MPHCLGGAPGDLRPPGRHVRRRARRELLRPDARRRRRGPRSQGARRRERGGDRRLHRGDRRPRSSSARATAPTTTPRPTWPRSSTAPRPGTPTRSSTSSTTARATTSSSSSPSPDAGATTRSTWSTSPSARSWARTARPFKTREGDVVGLESLLDEAVAEARKVVDENSPDLDPEEQRPGRRGRRPGGDQVRRPLAEPAQRLRLRLEENAGHERQHRRLSPVRLRPDPEHLPQGRGHARGDPRAAAGDRS